MRAFITTYALTRGIYEIEGEASKVSPEMFVGFIKCGGGHVRHYFHGNNWHLSREAAVARADEMRVAKIASLKKQITKLEKMTFGGGS